MKISYFVALTASMVATSAIAAVPVLENSTYRSSMYQPVAQNTSSYANTEVNSRLNKLQNDVIKLGNDLNSLKSYQSSINANVSGKLNNLSVATLGSGFSSTKTSMAGMPVSKIVTKPVVVTRSYSANGSEKSRYQNAYTLLRNGSVDQSIVEFNRIIADFSKGDYPDNAQYWLGEALLKKGDKQAAMIAFDKVVQNYPKSNKVPDALLKIGITKLTLNERTAAKQYFDYVALTYPKSNSANIAVERRSRAGL